MLYPSIILHTWPITISCPMKTKHRFMLETTLYQQSLPIGTPVINTRCGQFWLVAKLGPILETTLGLSSHKESQQVKKHLNKHLNEASHWSILREHGPTEIGDLLTAPGLPCQVDSEAGPTPRSRRGIHHCIEIKKPK